MSADLLDAMERAYSKLDEGNGDVGAAKSIIAAACNAHNKRAPVQVQAQGVALTNAQIDSLWAATLSTQPLPQPAFQHFARALLAQAQPASAEDERAIRQAAFNEAITACMRAIPDRAAVRAIGESAHYKACADAIRAIAALTGSEK